MNIPQGSGHVNKAKAVENWKADQTFRTCHVYLCLCMHSYNKEMHKRQGLADDKDNTMFQKKKIFKKDKDWH